MQAHVDQESKPRTNFLEQLFGDRPRDRIKLDDINRQANAGRIVGGARRVVGAGSRPRLQPAIEEPGDLADGHRAELDQSLAANLDGPRARVQPGARTLGAGHALHVRLELAANRTSGRATIFGQELVRDSTHFSACDQTLFRLFQRRTMIRSPVP